MDIQRAKRILGFSEWEQLSASTIDQKYRSIDARIKKIMSELPKARDYDEKRAYAMIKPYVQELFAAKTELYRALQWWSSWYSTQSDYHDDAWQDDEDSYSSGGGTDRWRDIFGNRDDFVRWAERERRKNHPWEEPKSKDEYEQRYSHSQNYSPPTHDMSWDRQPESFKNTIYWLLFALFLLIAYKWCVVVFENSWWDRNDTELPETETTPPHKYSTDEYRKEYEQDQKNALQYCQSLYKRFISVPWMYVPMSTSAFEHYGEFIRWGTRTISTKKGIQSWSMAIHSDRWASKSYMILVLDNRYTLIYGITDKEIIRNELWANLKFLYEKWKELTQRKKTTQR